MEAALQSRVTLNILTVIVKSSRPNALEFSPCQRWFEYIGGINCPFCRSGTAFDDLTTYDLGRLAVSGLIHRTRIDPDEVGLLVMGTVIYQVARLLI